MENWAIQGAVSRLRGLAEVFNGTVCSPATENEIHQARWMSRHIFGCDLPQEYMDFARYANGLEVDGLTIFSTRNSDLLESDDIISANQRLRFGEDISHIFIGQLDDRRLIGFSLINYRWEFVERGSRVYLSGSYDFNEFLGRLVDAVVNEDPASYC
jgi:hypothetical protein